MRKTSSEAYPGQRAREKRELFRQFCVSPIIEHQKRRFFALFDNCCFKCGLYANPDIPYQTRRLLCMDHHVPMALGGHLVPGNLVSLCRRCNERKLDMPPSTFYSSHELDSLQPLLEQQHSLFKFCFDWDKWQDSRAEYLLSLGIAQAVVDAVLHDQGDPDYVGLPQERVYIIIPATASKLPDAR